MRKFYNIDDDPKWWYYHSKCGCVYTSSNHPWVKHGLSLSGEYVIVCDKHDTTKIEDVIK